MSNQDNTTRADKVHINDGLSELRKVADQLTEAELEKIAAQAKQEAEDAKNAKHR
ncbi:hypothetical protein [Rouxiella sp. Mn2063]|uniref:hypothetical protein n=1 Tax=Rouxiella sp. Mn2063 TaxID=3395262 RepID=UPI003BD8C0B1